jgi:DeoR family fructose operon transcriptional repressor
MIDFNKNEEGGAVPQARRFRDILKTLEQQDFVQVNDLARRLEVSPMTVRRDLAELEQKGLLIRTHGGASKGEAIGSLFSFDRRLQRASAEKRAIGRAAGRLVEDGDILFVDCGTTPFSLCAHLRQRKRLRVITTSLPVASELLHCPGIRLALIGGEVVGERQAVYGAAAERAIGEYHADKAFIGADGLSLAGGLSSYDEQEAGVTRRMAENAGRVFLLCDSSKVERDSYVRFAPLSLFHALITDDRLPRAVRERYRRRGIKIITH